MPSLLPGGPRRWRRGTLRFAEENARIEAWLARIEALAGENYPLAVEHARAQRLIKGYGDTHERGWRNFSRIAEQLAALTPRADGAQVLARLSEAALADEEGVRLGQELAALRDAAAARARAVPGRPEPGWSGASQAPGRGG